MEKLLITSNFSFSHSVLYPFGELFAIFIKIRIVVCKVLSLEESKIYRLGKGLRHTVNLAMYFLTANDFSLC